MASIQQKRKKWCVVYSYTDENGQKKQKWETWGTKKEAEKRKREIEYQQESKTFIPPSVKTVSDLLYEFVTLYGKNKWALSTYDARKGLIDNYINPLIGHIKLTDLSTHQMDEYYNKALPATKSVLRNGHKDKGSTVSARNVCEIHKILNCAFRQAVRWEYLIKNPVENVTLPKPVKKVRDIWTAETFKKACNGCEDDRLLLCMHLAFACSLRVGEICGLTWNNVDISERSIAENNASVYVDKTLTRASADSMEALNDKDIIFVFPPIAAIHSTSVILKTPKTQSSVRRVWLPKSVALLLQRTRSAQNEWKEVLGGDYQDYNLVIALSNGRPVEDRILTGWFKKLIEKNGLPNVVFHSLRHTSTTYKLKLYGDIKSVQGDTGHAQAKMVSEVYSHILDEDRKRNAEIFEMAFYQTNEDTAPMDNTLTASKIDRLLEMLRHDPALADKLLSELEEVN